ncbi:hypothetical protein D3C83_190180 [compost metagenome]
MSIDRDAIVDDLQIVDVDRAARVVIAILVREAAVRLKPDPEANRARERARRE